jgi:hypothetical protein
LLILSFGGISLAQAMLRYQITIEVKSRLSLMRVRGCSLSSLNYNCWMDNLRPGRALRWRVVTAGWEGWGVVCGQRAPQRL